MELLSHFLHTYPLGPQGACEETLCWVREQLLNDQEDAAVRSAVSFDAVRLSRVDLHADWQCGWMLSAVLGEGLHLIKPAPSSGTPITREARSSASSSARDRCWRGSTTMRCRHAARPTTPTMPCLPRGVGRSLTRPRRSGGSNTSCGERGRRASRSIRLQCALRRPDKYWCQGDHGLGNGL